MLDVCGWLESTLDKPDPEYYFYLKRTFPFLVRYKSVTEGVGFSNTSAHCGVKVFRFDDINQSVLSQENLYFEGVTWTDCTPVFDGQESYRKWHMLSSRLLISEFICTTRVIWNAF